MIGLPGNPVSAMSVARQIIIPIIRYMLGGSASVTAFVQATLDANISSTTGREDTIPVRLVERDGATIAEPIFGKSNLIYTLVRADGYIVVPLNVTGYKAGTTVHVITF